MLLISTSLLLCCGAAPAQDRVLLTNGQTVSGAVLEATLDQLRYRDQEGEKTIAGREVWKIEFGKPPDSLQQGEEFLRKMDFLNAVNSFEAAAGGQDPPWLEAQARLRRAEALLAWARLDGQRAAEAVTAFGEWLAQWPAHFHAPRARSGLGYALALAGRVDDGAKQLEELSSLAFDKNLGPQVELGARLSRCEIYLMGNQPKVAETRLRDLVPNIQSALSNNAAPALRGELQSLLARSQMLLGDAVKANEGAPAARRYWESLLADSGAPLSVQAAATVGLAEAAREDGELRRAQLLLARVVATMPTGGEIGARALYSLGEVSEALADQPFPSKPYYQQVKERYPFTSWALKAAAKLGG